jgi:MATE family multidrug resistance protein
LTFPQALAAIFIPGEPQVIALAALLLPLAGLFQVFDGLQAVAAGVLRGTGDTRAPMISMLVGFWFVGVPTSMVLGFDWGFGLGAVGLWWGLVVGLGAVAIFLLIRVRTRLGEEVQRTKLPPTA